MKRPLLLICSLLLVAVNSSAIGPQIFYGMSASSATDYCDGTSWGVLTSPEFMLDFDHTTHWAKSCKSNKEQGTLNNTPTQTTPPTASPAECSGGKAMLINAATEYLVFDNSGTYLTANGSAGEISFCIYVDNTTSEYNYSTGDADFGGTPKEDRVLFGLGASSNILIGHEHGNDGLQYVENPSITGANLDVWIQVIFQWDASRCSAGNGNCGSDGELTRNYRIDVNGDGDFSDTGEGWQGWEDDDSGNGGNGGDDMGNFTGTVGTDEIVFGSYGGNYQTDFYLDGIEINSTMTSWEFVP